MSQETPSFIHVIPLGTEFLHAPFISETLISNLISQYNSAKKSLIFYSRRGNARAYICEDCGYYEKCPHCDIALSYHTDKSGNLVCHQCSLKIGVPLICPTCQGKRFNSVGIGIQRIEADLKKHLPDTFRLLRIDSDTDISAQEILEKIESSDIVLATNRAISLTHAEIGAVFFLHFELNLSIPEYDIEEITGAEIAYFKRQHIPLYIQTYTPDHPLLEELLFGNQKSLLDYFQKERKQFLYPPFTELATLRIHDEKKERVTMLMTHLINKISGIRQESTTITYDQDIWEKIRGEWTQKIVLRDKDISPIIRELEVEIVRNRAVTLEWK